MTPEEGALRRVVERLTSLGIPYMVTGSMASSHHGRPRSSHDVDLVIDPSEDALARLVSGLAEAGFYVDATTAHDAFRRRRQFNAIETTTACKIDLILRKQRAFSRQELSRRMEADLGSGLRVAIATAEDTILAKLEWARKAGESERQLADVAGIVAVAGAHLDRPYIERWSRDLGVLDLWRRLIEEPAK